MKPGQRFIFATGAVVIVVLGTALVSWFRALRGFSGQAESVTLSIPRLESSLLYWIAADRCGGWPAGRLTAQPGSPGGRQTGSGREYPLRAIHGPCSEPPQRCERGQLELYSF
jgi:hypothetical protein